MTGQSHFLVVFLLRKVTLQNHINSVKWLWWILTRWPLFCKSLQWGLCSYVWKLADFFILCFKKSAKWITTVLCTLHSVHKNSVPWMHAVTSTPYRDFTQLHPLRTMNERGHTNSVPWIHAVCRLRQVTFIQINHRIFWANCVNPWYRVGVTPFIHGTELMQFGKVTLPSKKNQH